ncbi:hypothetical protein QUF64_04550 [Anaerolineales bacterium HSG6]|nr:hypothetical protein [Anaerolineales bacterium HSG6]MDM8529648.1 hypothetical protein [Anaerolineales bacterium HSG25]
MQAQTMKSKKKRRIYPELVPTPAERETTYYAALELVAIIDENLRRGVFHYRNRAGRLLSTLDEVINAILTDNLQLPAPKQEESVWVAPQERAA